MPFLKPTGRRQSARHLPVGLRFGGAGADRRPGDELGEVLRHDRIERFGARRQPELGHVQKQLAREQDPLLDVERIVEIRIVDKPLPAHRGARLLEIHPHDQHQRGADLHRDSAFRRRHTRAPPPRRESSTGRPPRTAADRAAPGWRARPRASGSTVSAARAVSGRRRLTSSGVASKSLEATLTFCNRSWNIGHCATYMDVRMVQSSGKNLRSSALVRYDTPPVPPVPRL